MTTGEYVADGAATSSPLAGRELTAPSAPESGVGVAVSVTVTVDKATVTVTGTQLAASFTAPPAAPEPVPAEEAAMTVTYFVEVLVPVRVVVDSVSTAPSFVVTPAASPEFPEPGSVAYTVAVEVCLIVVVTTVVLVPDPRV